MRSASHASRYVTSAGSPSPPGIAYDARAISGYVTARVAATKNNATAASSRPEGELDGELDAEEDGIGGRVAHQQTVWRGVERNAGRPETRGDSLASRFRRHLHDEVPQADGARRRRRRADARPRVQPDVMVVAAGGD